MTDRILAPAGESDGTLDAGLRFLLEVLDGTAALVAEPHRDGRLRVLAGRGIQGQPASPPEVLLESLRRAPGGVLWPGPDDNWPADWMGCPAGSLQVAFLSGEGPDPQILVAVAAGAPRALPPGKRDVLRDLLGLVAGHSRLSASLRAGVVDLEDGLASASGDEFFAWLVRNVTATLGLRCALVGELVGPNWDTIQVRAIHLDGEAAEPFRYALAGTPCERVVGRKPCIFPERVRESFPGDTILADLDMECYAGVPLFDSQGRAVGLLAALDGKAARGEHLEAVVSLLARMAPRAAAEIERRRAVEELQALLEATAKPAVSEVLRSLTRSLARALRVRGAMVASRLVGARSGLRVQAVHWDGSWIEVSDGPLAGSPWKGLADADHIVLGEKELAAHAGDPLVRATGARAAVAEILRDARGEAIGFLAVLHDRALDGRVSRSTAFRIVSALAGAELERQQEEERRLALERRVLEAQRLESLGTLAGGLAHDFNNLLVGVLGNLNLALSELPESGTARRLLEDAERSGQRAADLARQLLAYSGRGRFVVVPLDLNALLEDVGRLLRVALPHGAELRLEPARSLPEVPADATQLRQVLMNLVRNAGEALSSSGDIVRISTGLARLDEDALRELDFSVGMRPGDHVFLEVADTGSGMDEATRARIFEPFFSTRAAGRGLGLAAVQGIARGHHGGIGLRTAPGAGTSVRLYLPVVETVAGTAAVASGGDTDAASAGTALIVDDEESVRVVAARMLERLGWEVEMAADGEEGVERYREGRGRFRLVLLDLTMPRMDGEQALRRLQEIDPAAPVVLMSGYSAEEASDRFREFGSVAFLHKPFRLADLRAVLSRALQRSV